MIVKLTSIFRRSRSLYPGWCSTERRPSRPSCESEGPVGKSVHEAGRDYGEQDSGPPFPSVRWFSKTAHTISLSIRESWIRACAFHEQTRDSKPDDGSGSSDDVLKAGRGSDLFCNDMPIWEARELIMDSIGVGVDCPICDQFCRSYKRRLNYSMAAFIVRLTAEWKRNADSNAWVHISEFPSLYRGGDYAKAAYWKLVESKPATPEDKTNRVGFWRPTPLGIEFAYGRATVPAYCHVYNGTPLRFSEDLVNVHEALNGRFNYEDIWC